MSEELKVQASRDVVGSPPSDVLPDAKESTQNISGDSRENHRQGIFAERWDALMDGFGEACENNKVQIAFAAAIHPDEKDPLIFMRGSLYENATLLARLLRILKNQINSELEC